MLRRSLLTNDRKYVSVIIPPPRHRYRRLISDSKQPKLEQKSISKDMPTFNPSFQQQQEKQQVVSRIRQSWNNGNMMLFLGYSGLSIWLIDRYLQYDQAYTKREAEQMIKTIQEETAMKRRELFQQNYSRPTLYQCSVIEEYKNMGGYYGLQNIQLYDVVDIIEENVGPDEYYHLCRTYEEYITTNDDRNTTNGEKPPTTIIIKSIGWYPKKFLKRIETNTK